MNNMIVYRVWLALRVCTNTIAGKDKNPEAVKDALIKILKHQEGSRSYFKERTPAEMGRESLLMLPSVFDWIVTRYFKDVGK